MFPLRKERVQYWRALLIVLCSRLSFTVFFLPNQALFLTPPAVQCRMDCVVVSLTCNAPRTPKKTTPPKPKSLFLKTRNRQPANAALQGKCIFYKTPIFCCSSDQFKCMLIACPSMSRCFISNLQFTVAPINNNHIVAFAVKYGR